jgi:hypothetical protein
MAIVPDVLATTASRVIFACMQRLAHLSAVARMRRRAVNHVRRTALAPTAP